MKTSRYCLLATATSLTLALCAQGETPAGFTSGILIVNEELTGNPTNGSINHFQLVDDAPQWDYRVFRAANPGREIPGAICHAQITDGVMYVVSNHPAMAGSYDMASTLTIVDANTMQWLDAVEVTDPDGRILQSRATLTASNGTTFLTTISGIYAYRVTDNGSGKKLQYIDVVPTTRAEGAISPALYQYPSQSGMMANIGNTIYAATQSKGLARFDADAPESITFTSVGKMKAAGLPADIPDACGIGSVVKSKDGMLWLSVTADTEATGDAAPWLICHNPATGTFNAVAVPEGLYPPANSWYAWTPDGFHACATENALVWNGGPSNWFSNSHIYKYDIDNDKFLELLDLEAEAKEKALDTPWMLYGCSMRTDPSNGDLYLSLFKDYVDTRYTLRRLDANGTHIADYPMKADLWFPGLPIFPAHSQASAERIESHTSPTLSLRGNFLTVNTPHAGTLTVYSTSGQAVMQRYVGPQQTLSVAHLTPGVYLACLNGQTLKFAR